MLRVINKSFEDIAQKEGGIQGFLGGLRDLGSSSTQPNSNMKTNFQDKTDEVTQKLSSAAKELGDVLGNFGA